MLLADKFQNQTSPVLGMKLIPKAPGKNRLRIALYSHDTMGLGHTRRNLLIAYALKRAHIEADILLITGAYESAQFKMPQGVDCLTLPSLYKDAQGNYKAKVLDISLENLMELRSRAIKSALKSFKPDLFIVDNVPLGAVEELKPILKKLKKRGQTKCVLGLRDILDDPETTKKQWRERKNHKAISKYYDAVWVYGDPSIYDLVEKYEFPIETKEKLSYLGYFDQRLRLEFASEAVDENGKIVKKQPPFVLCQVGGGQDGQRLALAFAAVSLPKGWKAVLVTGPFFPGQIKEELLGIAKERSDLAIYEFISEPTVLLSKAEKVISMGGYNSVNEALSFEKPLLVVPRVTPRLEQLERVKAMEPHGLLDYLHPDQLSSEALSEWLRSPVKPPKVHASFDFEAVERIAQEARKLLALKGNHVYA